MKYYPIYLSLQGKPVSVIGGGPVGLRRARALVAAGACVTVYAQVFSPEFFEIQAQCVSWTYDPASEFVFLPGTVLVSLCTGNPHVHRALVYQAQKKSILVEDTAQATRGNYIVPAVLDLPEAIFTVSTLGNSPRIAQEIQRQWQEQYGQKFSHRLRLLGKVRTFSKRLEKSARQDVIEHSLRLSQDQLSRWIEEYIDED